MQVVKRDGSVVPFDRGKIESALSRCFKNVGVGDADIPFLTDCAVNVIKDKYTQPTVEQIQDIVETILLSAGEFDAAKHYILYRANKTRLRETRSVPKSVKDAFDESAKYFPTTLQQFQFFDKYSRYDYTLGRRETWVETVDRSVSFLRELSGDKIPMGDIRSAILNMEAMPSMRLLAMAGQAARRNNIAIYNCSYLPVDSLASFTEALSISMNGCGVGYSVERDNIENFPRVARQDGTTDHHVIDDSTEGWIEALDIGLSSWFKGKDVTFDYSSIRPAGAPLRSKGGRASGPAPLRHMLDFTRSRVLSRQGSFIRPIDAHDIMCVIGGAAISGGIRRTAMISLFDYDDTEMLNCKSGNFERNNNQRWNANNSIIWPNRELTQVEVARFFLSMAETGRGEPGIFNRRAAIATAPSRRVSRQFGTNPCGEVILRPRQFCNLSSVVARPHDTIQSLAEKVRVATIIGTIQSMATHFPGLSPLWRVNCEEERLLGVDMSGQMDCKVAQDSSVQQYLRDIAIQTNIEIARKLSINQSAAVTCVKPSGNSSLLLGCAPGIHPRWARKYIRNVRVNTHTPMYHVLTEAGMPGDPENGQMPESANTWVFHFPVESPYGTIVRADRSAIDQCKYWLQVKQSWTEHNPSVTITYKEEEILDVIKWIWENQDVIGGMAFMPDVNTEYEQMPYVEVDELPTIPDVDFSKIYQGEVTDMTTAAQEFACLAGSCDI